MATAAEATYEILKPGVAEFREKGGPHNDFVQLDAQKASSRPAVLPAPSFKLIIAQRLPDARPDRVLFGALKDPVCRLRQPIPLELAIEEGEVVLTWAEVDEFGYGATMGAALDDFGHAIRELYHRLYAADVKLGADLQNVKRVLGEYIEPRPKQ